MYSWEYVAVAYYIGGVTVMFIVTQADRLFGGKSKQKLPIAISAIMAMIWPVTIILATVTRRNNLFNGGYNVE